VALSRLRTITNKQIEVKMNTCELWLKYSCEQFIDNEKTGERIIYKNGFVEAIAEIISNPAEVRVMPKIAKHIINISIIIQSYDGDSLNIGITKNGKTLYRQVELPSMSVKTKSYKPFELTESEFIEIFNANKFEVVKILSNFSA
jgi:polyphosphate kinase